MTSLTWRVKASSESFTRDHARDMQRLQPVAAVQSERARQQIARSCWRIFCSNGAMRFFLSGALLVLLASAGFASPPLPLTLKDISLMLRSGYSSEAVEREIAVRHFIGTLDANGEKNLLQA